jgi:hypothetical protein
MGLVLHVEWLFLRGLGRTMASAPYPIPRLELLGGHSEALKPEFLAEA